MSCYGVPATILNIKEYGGNTVVSGPLKDLDTADIYKTFSYEKAGLALKGDSSSSGYFVKTNWPLSVPFVFKRYGALWYKRFQISFDISPLGIDPALDADIIVEPSVDSYWKLPDGVVVRLSIGVIR